MRRFIAAAAVLWSSAALGQVAVLTAGRGSAAQFDANDFFVDDLSTDPTPATTGSGTLVDPWTNLCYALQHRTWSAGERLILRDGTYRNAFSGGFVADGTQQQRWDNCDDDEADDPSSDGSHTVMPLLSNITGAAGNPVIIEPYPGETAIVSGSSASVLDAWTQCAAPNDHTWHRTDSFSSNGTQRLAYLGSVNLANEPWQYELIYQSGTMSCGAASLGAGEYGTANSGNDTYVRLLDGSDPSGLISIICEFGECARTVVMHNGAQYVTVRSNPAGGSLVIRDGYYIGYVDGGSTDSSFEDVVWLSGGGRDYGYCFRVSNGSDVTLSGGSCRYATGECIGPYGGGPVTGTNISGVVVEYMTIEHCGRGWDVAGGGNGTSLGMGIILKNCSNCIARYNTTYDTYRSGVQVNTSSGTCGGGACNSDDVQVYGNRVSRYCRFTTTTLQSDCGGILARADGVSNTVHRPLFLNNYVFGDWEAGDVSGGGNPFGIYFDGSVGADSEDAEGEHNTVRGARNAGIAGIDTDTLALRGNLLDGNSQGSSQCNGEVSHCELYLDATAAGTIILDGNTLWAPNSTDVVYRIQGTSSTTRTNWTGVDANAEQADPTWGDADDPEPTNAALNDALNPCAVTLDLLEATRGSPCTPGAVEL